MKVKATLFALLVAAAIFAVPGTASGAERYVGNLVDLTGTLPRRTTDFFTIHIDQYSSDGEVASLLTALKAKGQVGLRESVWDLKEKGWFRIGSMLGYHLPVIRQRPTPDGGKVIRALTDRPIQIWELRNNTRSVQYPFGYIELKLDASGRGEGQMIAAAKIRLTEDGIEIESFSTQPWKITNVRPEKVE